MSVIDTNPPVAPAPPSCPRWCAGDHSGDYADAHHAELGRVAKTGAELALVVALVRPVDGDGPPAIELSWEGADEDNTDHYLMEALEMDPDEIPHLAELLMHAHTMSTRGGRS